MTPKIKPFALIVLDGWGHRETAEHNAIAAAKTPFFDHLWKTYPHSILDASEEHVGLPGGQMGNSEIGHMTIGAGATIDADLVRITKAIRNGEFQKNGAFSQLFHHVKENDATLHAVGLLSPGGIHSHHEHLKAFLRAAKEEGITKIAVHAITDGRDTPPQSAAKFLAELEELLAELGVGSIATATGRFYAMDRDQNWDRLAKAEDALFNCVGTECRAEKPSNFISKLHAEGKMDEHLEPVVFLDDTGKGYPIGKNDGVLMYNFRADRARMISKKISDRSTSDNLCFVTMTEYDKSIECLVAFPSKNVDATLAGEISAAGIRQAHIAETEKYAHATYFLNGGREEPYAEEKHVLIESRKDVPTHDLAPEMRAKEITDVTIKEITNGTDFVFVNFANADMVGHTANVPAIITAVETVDAELRRLVEFILSKHGAVFITSDHGNAETNIDIETGEKHTAHTLNLVPAILTVHGGSLANGTLCDVAPTVLNLLGLPAPKSMTGKDLYTR